MYPKQRKILKIFNEIESQKRQPMTVNDLRNELHIIAPPNKILFLLDDLKNNGYLTRLNYDPFSTTEKIKFELSLKGLSYKYIVWHTRFQWIVDNVLPIVALIIAIIGLFS